jgi:hypothetical protein
MKNIHVYWPKGNAENEIKLLKKWNHRLLPKEPSKKFAELILGEVDFTPLGIHH